MNGYLASVYLLLSRILPPRELSKLLGKSLLVRNTTHEKGGIT